MSKIILYQFPISHFCEKIRWTLDYKSIPHIKQTLLPGLHSKKMKKLTGQYSVPVIKHQDTYLHDSSKIISYLEEQFPEKPLNPKSQENLQQALNWENFADANIGPQVRVLLYHHLLQEPQIVSKFFTKDGPLYGPLFVKLAFPKLEKVMRKHMRINLETSIQAKDHLDKSLDKVIEALDGKNYLVGEQFSRADLSVASLLAPLIMPPAYGLKKPELPDELNKILESFEPKLTWLRQMYKRHR